MKSPLMPLVRGFLWATGAFVLCVGVSTWIIGTELMLAGFWLYVVVFFAVLVWAPCFVAVSGYGYLWRLITRQPPPPDAASTSEHRAPYG